MNITKPGLLYLAAAMLALAPHPARALEGSPASTRSANLDLARQLNQAFVQVAEDVSPTVVVITVEQKPSTAKSDDSQDDSGDPMEQFRRFFREQHQQEQPEDTTGQGSGVIIRKDGYILTNRHVVEDAEKIEVKLQDGRTFKAKIRGVDALADVAVVKIEANDLPVAKLADSDKTRVGEFAIAIGAPFALDYSVTFGHVSAKNRSHIIVPTDSESLMMDQSFIQTDANINPGNSGGPLVNIEGEVIGINTLIRGLHTGIGFAIPINMAREVADKLITDGKFTRPWLGISIQSLQEDPDFQELISHASNDAASRTVPSEGVVVEGIVSDGPAANSKLHTFDLIRTVDGKPVATAQQLKDEIRTKKIGQNVTLDVLRIVKQVVKPVTIVVQPGEYVDNSDSASNRDTSPDEPHSSGNALGLNIKPLTIDVAKKLHVDMGAGVVVTHVDRDGLAFQSGIGEGDLITSIDEHPVTNTRQFLQALRNVDTKKGAVIHFISDGSAKTEVLKEGAR